MQRSPVTEYDMTVAAGVPRAVMPDKRELSLHRALAARCLTFAMLRNSATYARHLGTESAHDHIMGVEHPVAGNDIVPNLRGALG